MDASFKQRCEAVLADAHQGWREVLAPVVRTFRPYAVKALTAWRWRSRSCQASGLAQQLAPGTGKVSRIRGNASVTSADRHSDKASAHELLR